MTTSIDDLQPLDTEVRSHLDAGGIPNIDLTDAVARRAWLTVEVDRMFALFGRPGPDVAEIRDHQVSVDGGSILVRTYHPMHDPERDRPVPAHVLLHGGGWTTGSIHESVVDADARHRAVAANCVVVTVEYRLAPEHPFPTAVHDVVLAVHWVRTHAAALGVDPTVITLGGNSAGGNLAAAAVVADPTLGVRALILEVPACDLRPSALIADAVHADPRFAPTELAMVDLILPDYLGDLDHAESPLASPVLAELERFPETHILTAELDLLRHGAERFESRLRAAGVDVTIDCYVGALHGSPILTGTWETARRWQQDVLAILDDIHRRARPMSRPTDAEDLRWP